MRERIAWMLVGVLLCLSLMLCGYKIPAGPNQTTFFPGPISVNGDATISGNIAATRSMSAESLQASTIFRARQCAVVDHTLLVGGPARFLDSVYVGGQSLTPLKGSGTLDFDLTSITEQDKQFTLTGASVGDPVYLGIPNGSVTATVEYTAWVLSSNTINVRAKTRVAGENPASGTFKVVVLR